MKQETVWIETPERVRFAYRIAESATRAAAYSIDLAMQLALAGIVIALLVGAMALSGNALFLAFVITTVFAIQWAYGFAFEAALGGRTPGKIAMRLRVVRLDGEALDIRSIALRNLCRAADGMPFMLVPLLGGFVSVADRYSRRLGDMVAGTIVVQDERGALARPIAELPPEATLASPYRLPLGARLLERELYVLRRFFSGSDSMPQVRRQALERELIEKVAKRLGIEPGEDKRFLQSVYLAHEPVASTEFARERRPAHAELEGLLKHASLRGAPSLGTDAGRFVALYRSACADLAAARGASLAEDLIEYLNSLVGEARALIYAAPPFSPQRARQAILEEAPRRIVKRWPFLLCATLLFALPFSWSLASAARDPDTALAWSNPATLESMEEAYDEIAFDGRSTPETAFMTAFYISNNVSIDFLSMATGVFFGTGTAFVLIENGLGLGSVLGYVKAKGHGMAITRFISAHAPFELAGLLLSGAAGLLLGWTLIRAQRQSRGAALRQAMDDFMPLAAAAATLTFLAAFIEAFVGPSQATLPVRLGIATVCCILLAAYLLSPWLRAQRAGTRP